MKTKKTILKLKIFQQIASDYMIEKRHFIEEMIVPAVMDGDTVVSKEKKIPGHFAENGQTKLSLNIKSVITRQLPDIMKKFDTDCQDIRDMNAAVHPERKTILLDPQTKQNEYTPAGKIKMRKELNDLVESEIEIDQRITPESDYGYLTEDQKTAFSGIVIPEQHEEVDDKEKKKK